MLYAFKDEFDPLAGHLARMMAWAAKLPAGTGWLLGLATLTAVAAIDTLGRDYGLRCFPLYIPLICLAAWTLQPRSGLLFVCGTAIVAMLPDLLDARPNVIMGLNLGLRLAVYLILAMILTACRRSYEIARIFASLDSLTQVLNKVAFHREFNRLLNVRRGPATWLMIAFVDLDDFKTVNGAHGHAAGDDILRRFSGAAITGIRRGDLIGRIGGDEFAIVVSAPDELAAQAAARSLHARLMDALADTSVSTTCSMGAVIVPPYVRRTQAELIADADQLMYRVKMKGKGAVLFRPAIEEAASDAKDVFGCHPINAKKTGF